MAFIIDLYIVLQDLNVLESMKWEAVIVDECQSSRIFSHFKQIKMLRTAMRLLLVNGQLKVCAHVCFFLSIRCLILGLHSPFIGALFNVLDL
jgi:hypothetical protein